MYKLENFNREDINSFLSWLEGTDSKFLYQFGGPRYSYPLDKNQVIEDMKTENSVLLKFVDSENIIGHCQFIRINSKESNASIGRLLINPAFRNMGYGQKMISAMISYAKNELNLSKLLLRVFDFNSNAIACYEKIGFKKCGSESKYIEAFNEKWVTLSMELKL